MGELIDTCRRSPVKWPSWTLPRAEESTARNTQLAGGSVSEVCELSREGETRSPSPLGSQDSPSDPPANWPAFRWPASARGRVRTHEPPAISEKCLLINSLRKLGSAHSRFDRAVQRILRTNFSIRAWRMPLTYVTTRRECCGLKRACITRVRGSCIRNHLASLVSGFQGNHVGGSQTPVVLDVLRVGLILWSM
jgi:hypothetical protein